MSSLQHSAATDVGLKRTNNEDTILSNPRAGLWLVADGMGGHAAGEVASAIVAETIEQQISCGATLEQAIRQAHRAVIDAADAGRGGPGMGSTVVALHSQGTSYEIAWVGDSRAYLWQPRGKLNALVGGDTVVDDGAEQLYGELIQLTTDHSYVQMLFDTGAISADEMHKHPDKNIITQCLGSVDIDAVAVDVCRMKWYPDDCILLCSDGLSDAVSDEQIQQVLQDKGDVQSATQALIALALEQGGADNISVTLISNPKPEGDGVQRLKIWWQHCCDKMAKYLGNL